MIGAEQGGLRSDNDVWEFHNPNFQCGQPQLLENVKRKATPEEKKLKNDDVSKVLHDVKDMKGKQDEMTAKLEQMKRYTFFTPFLLFFYSPNLLLFFHGFLALHISVFLSCFLSKTDVLIKLN